MARDRVLTNHNIVQGCNRLLVSTADRRTLTGELLQSDPVRDLALLAVLDDPGPALIFRREPAIRPGLGVLAYGFQFTGVLHAGPNGMTGEVTALQGLRDNQTVLQVSAPLRSGMGGGPVLDGQGHVIGINYARLNPDRLGAAPIRPDYAQDVGFAIKSSEALAFLQAAGVQPLLANSYGSERSATALAMQARPATVLIRCLY